jgi:hypothetical protein
MAELGLLRVAGARAAPAASVVQREPARATPVVHRPAARATVNGSAKVLLSWPYGPAWFERPQTIGDSAQVIGDLELRGANTNKTSGAYADSSMRRSTTIVRWPMSRSRRPMHGDRDRALGVVTCARQQGERIARQDRTLGDRLDPPKFAVLRHFRPRGAFFRSSVSSTQ